MADEPTLIIEIDPSGGMTNEDYFAWNVAGCIRTLRNAPLERDITLMVYDIHKTVLRRKGFSEEHLAIGDKYVEIAKKRYFD